MLSGEKWNVIPDEKTLNETVAKLRASGIAVYLVENRRRALETIKGLIPAGASVMAGGSKTLDEMGSSLTSNLASMDGRTSIARSGTNAMRKREMNCAGAQCLLTITSPA